jgi:protease-4
MQRRSLHRRILGSWVLVVVIGLLIGVLIAPVAWNVTNAAQRAGVAPGGSTIAVVPIAGAIDGGSAQDVSTAIRRANQDSSVEAIVLVANSPGGSAAASEQLYLAVSDVANDTPVVTSVDAVAASGAYYAVAPSDRIYVKPSSIVGSVGVLAVTGRDLTPNDVVVTTGPDKLGGSRRDFRYTLESLRRAFVGAVFAQRGDRIELSRATVSKASTWDGASAVRNGMADEIGGRKAAIRHAAELAEVENYNVKVYRSSGRPVTFVSRNAYLASSAPEKRAVNATYLTGERPVTGPVFLMIQQRYVTRPNDTVAAAAEVSDDGR